MEGEVLWGRKSALVGRLLSDEVEDDLSVNLSFRGGAADAAGFRNKHIQDQDQRDGSDADEAQGSQECLWP